jgi:hypothetical protein
MSKVAIWVLVGVIVVGGGYYALNSSKNDNTNTLENGVVVDKNQEDSTTNTEVTPEVTPSDKKMAFSQFIATNKGSYECTVNQYVNDIASKGTVYMNQGLIRGDFNTKVSGISIDTSLIVRDGYTYTWSSALPGSGFKSKVVANGNANTNTGTSGQYSFNAEQIGDYDCKVWAFDESKFTLPVSITFREV